MYNFAKLRPYHVNSLELWLQGLEMTKGLTTGKLFSNFIV